VHDPVASLLEHRGLQPADAALHGEARAPPDQTVDQVFHEFDMLVEFELLDQIAQSEGKVDRPAFRVPVFRHKRNICMRAEYARALGGRSDCVQGGERRHKGRQDPRVRFGTDVAGHAAVGEKRRLFQAARQGGALYAEVGSRQSLAVIQNLPDPQDLPHPFVGFPALPEEASALLHIVPQVRADGGGQREPVRDHDRAVGFQAAPRHLLRAEYVKRLLTGDHSLGQGPGVAAPEYQGVGDGYGAPHRFPDLFDHAVDLSDAF